MNRVPSLSTRVVRLRATGMHPTHEAEARVDDRLNRLPNYEPDAMRESTCWMIGGGGLGGEIGHGLARNGIGKLLVTDPDLVELSNLNRQHFYPRNLYRNKAIELVRELVAEAIHPTVLVGMAMTAQEAIERRLTKEADVVVCGVDNDTTRVDVARWALERGKPVVFTGVNNRADYGYTFVQTSKAGDPCFICLFPDAFTNDERNPCAVGSSIDILKSMAGPVLYAVGALLMKQRVMKWHYKEIFLSGAGEDGNREIRQRADCPLCGRRTGPSHKVNTRGSATIRADQTTLT